MAKNVKSKKNVHNTKTAPNAHYLNKVVNKHNGRQWQIQTKRGTKRNQIGRNKNGETNLKIMVDIVG